MTLMRLFIYFIKIICYKICNYMKYSIFILFRLFSLSLNNLKNPGNLIIFRQSGFFSYNLSINNSYEHGYSSHFILY